MNLFSKIDSRINYYNIYSIRKGLETLRLEYLRAAKYKSFRYVKELINTANKIHNKVKHLDKCNGNTIDIIDVFITNLNKQIKNDFGK